MNSPTITMDRAAAIAKLESYEAAAKNNPRAFAEIDKGLIEGYRALAKGRRLVDVNEAIRAGGVNIAGLPKLAIARAHAESTRWTPTSTWSLSENKTVTNGGGIFDWRTSNRQRMTDDRLEWRIPADYLPGVRTPPSWSARAMVPLIPLPLRPKFKLENYFILWEASWHHTPTDPYLLRPLAGSLMEIIAEWDLTPLEIAAVRNGRT